MLLYVCILVCGAWRLVLREAGLHFDGESTPLSGTFGISAQPLEASPVDI